MAAIICGSSSCVMIARTMSNPSPLRAHALMHCIRAMRDRIGDGCTNDFVIASNDGQHRNLEFAIQIVQCFGRSEDVNARVHQRVHDDSIRPFFSRSIASPNAVDPIAAMIAMEPTGFRYFAAK